MFEKKPVTVNGKKYYRISEVCAILGIFKNTLYNWEKKKKIPRAYRDPMSGWRLYAEEDIEKIMSLSGRGKVLPLA